MGEGIGNDAAIIPYITSANIACGYHAGNEITMRDTIMLAKNAGVAIGAHPSFLDRENFGRTAIKEITPQQVYELITEQLRTLLNIAVQCGTCLHHIKPHGALYNMAAKDGLLAKAVANAVHDFDRQLVLFGLSGSYLIEEAKALGIKTASEVFADRTYQDDGSLTPRTQADALISDENKAIEQVIRMIKKGEVISTSGKTVAIVAETVCVHGDGKNAVAFAKAIHTKLKSEKIAIQAV